MKKMFLVVVAAWLMLSTVTPALAFKQLSDAWKVQYAGEKADAEFLKLVGEAKCNVCHIDKEDKKKVRNPYGTTVHDLFEKSGFSFKDFKKEPEKYADQVKDLFKKVEEEKSGDETHKTFKARMDAKLLPGGNVQGKKE